MLVAAAVLAGMVACGRPADPSTAGGKSQPTGAQGQLRAISGDGLPLVAAIPPVARARAVAQAEDMLAGVRVPPGSRLVDSFSGRQLTGPAVRPLCDPVEDDTLRWIVARSAGAVAAFLSSHVPAQMTMSGSGRNTSSGTVTSYFLTDDPRGHASSNDELVFAWASAGTSTVLRADALTVPGRDCVNPGGPMVPVEPDHHHSLPAGTARG